MTGAEDARRTFRQIIDHSRDAYIEFDSRLVVTEWSRSAETLLGWTRREMIGRPATDVVTPNFAEVLEQGTELLLASSAGPRVGAEAPGLLPAPAPPRVEPPAPVELELELRHRDGRTVLALATAFVVPSPNGLRVGGFVHDDDDDAGGGHQPLALGRLHDPLTGLPLRELFTRRIAHEVVGIGQRAGSVAVVVVDFDRFKAINDALGHHVGDQLLVSAVARLRAAAGPDRPRLGRLGGDQLLAVLVADGRDRTDAAARAEAFAGRILEAFDTAFDAGSTEVFLSPSVGIAATADPTADAATLLADADAAMHRNKQSVTGSHTVFETGMRQEVVQRLETEHALHRAIDRQELTLHYQPVVPLARALSASGSFHSFGPRARLDAERTRGLFGVEALVRWRHPELGLVEPERFIPVAEESGLIIPIGNWVLTQACRQLQWWRSEGLVGPAVSVEVNLSARQIDHPALPEALERALDETGLPAGCVTLEITESALMRDAGAALEVLRALKAVGVTLAIDDFGTGYSSLSYLQRLPLDILKVDKSFVAALPTGRGSAIVSAVIELAHALGLVVVAEGVETSAQLDVLCELGCDYAQGFYFSYPVPAVELPARLAVPGPRLTA